MEIFTTLSSQRNAAEDAEAGIPALGFSNSAGANLARTNPGPASQQAGNSPGQLRVERERNGKASRERTARSY